MKFDKLVKFLLVIVVLVSSQWACQTLAPTQPAAPTAVTEMPAAASPAELTDEEIMSGIQQSLDVFGDAYTNNQPDALATVIDSENKPFYRIVTSRFNDYQESYLAGQVDFRFTATSIQRREYGYVIAHIETQNGRHSDWVFRQLNGIWVLSEPTVEQVGEPVETVTDHFVFKTYPWADDVNGRIMAMMETARADAEKILGVAPEEKANVKIMPIYGLSPFNPMGAIAVYIKEQGPIKNIIEIYAPFSYAYGSYDPELGWDGELQTTLTHEYTHMVHARSFDQAGRLSDWMSEGLAEYVSNTDDANIYYACSAMREGTLIPILDESGQLAKQDLMHLTMLNQDVRLGYDYAQGLVKFTVENYGGLDGFWKLANALDETGDFKKAVESAYGISFEEFDRQWLEWLASQC